MEDIIKNDAIGSIKKYRLGEEFVFFTYSNDQAEPQRITRKVRRTLIQFHFCLRGELKFNFNEGKYSRKLSEDKGLFLYNPQKDLPLDFEVSPKSYGIFLLMSIRQFHGLFSEDVSFINFLKNDHKYYQEIIITPAMSVVLSQVMNFNLHSYVQPIYMRGKALELISLCFNRPDEVNTEQCPFLLDEQNVSKIKKAKEIIIKNMINPPTLKELSEEIGLGLKKLKEGFKEIYGDTVYGFLINYKMEYAQNLLETGQYNVNEISSKVGYSTASHFIAAFKKKFGTTPKKYMNTQQI